MPNPQRDAPNGVPSRAEPTPKVSGPGDPEKGKIEFRVEGVVDGYRTTAVFDCHPNRLRTAIARLAGHGLERPAFLRPRRHPALPQAPRTAQDPREAGRCVALARDHRLPRPGPLL